MWPKQLDMEKLSRLNKLMDVAEAVKRRFIKKEGENEEEELNHHPVEIQYRLAERTGIFHFLGSTYKKGIRKLIDEPIEKEEVGEIFISLSSRLVKAYALLFATLIFCLVILLIQSKDNRKQQYVLDKQAMQLSKLIQKEAATEESVFILESGNISQEISRELARKQNSTNRNISAPLIGRIIAFSRMMANDNAYARALDGTRDETRHNPEKGSLLISLRTANIGIESYDQIFQQADFSLADLSGAKLWEAYFRNINLQKANLNRADLQDGNLEEADLQMATFQGAFLLNAKMEGANLSKANLDGANLWMANLKNTMLEDISIKGADLTDAMLTGARAKQRQMDDFLEAKADTTGMIWTEDTD